MKRKYILNKVVTGGFLIATLMGMTACDPLGIEPTTKVDVDRFWLNPQLARSYVTNFYLWNPVASGDKFQSEQWSDNCQGNCEKDWNTYYQLTFNNRQYDSETSAPAFSAPWGDSYKRIRAVNIGLEKIATSGAISEELKQQLLAECYFFRAYIYFDLVKFWGPVPYVDKSLNLTDETFLPREKREFIFDKILEDLTASLEHFKAFNKKSELGMVNADVVNSFISRVALYAANAAEASAKGLYATDDKEGLFTFTKNANQYYELSHQAAMQVYGKYTLADNYEDLFTSENAHKSSEAIWPVMFRESNRHGFNPTGVNGPDGTYYGGNEKTSFGWNLRSGLFPTQDLVDCYLQKDEADGQWKQWWKTKQAADLGVTVVDGVIKGKGADYRKIYEGRDARFYATVTYDGAYMGPAKEMYLIQTWIDRTTASATGGAYEYSALHTGYKSTEGLLAPTGKGSCQTITGYYSRKYSHFDSFNDDGTLKGTQRTTCYFNIRYAEILLNLAEAGIKLNKPEAEGYINQIRNRAGLSNFSSAIEGHNLWEEMKIQRRLEFAFECPGFRYFDLLRWSEAEGKSVITELNKPSRGIHIFRKGIESKIMGQNGYPAEPGSDNYFVPYFETVSMDYENYQRKFDHWRYYFAPFPQTTLTSYTELVQNPGWTGFKYNN